MQIIDSIWFRLKVNSQRRIFGYVPAYCTGAETYEAQIKTIPGSEQINLLKVIYLFSSLGLYRSKHQLLSTSYQRQLTGSLARNGRGAIAGSLTLLFFLKKQRIYVWMHRMIVLRPVRRLILCHIFSKPYAHNHLIPKTTYLHRWGFCAKRVI